MWMGRPSRASRALHCAGASPLVQSASTLGRRESSSSLREGLDHAMVEPAAEKQPPQHAEHTPEEVPKSVLDSPSRRSSERGDGTPEVLSADEWGDFDFDHT